MPTNQGSYTATALPVDGTTIDAADVVTDMTGLINEFNKSIDDNKIASSAGIASSKLAEGNAFVPIAAILPYWSSGAAAPTNFLYCDGSTVSDADSPLNGKVLPNIMGAKFIRGVANSDLRTTPANGGSDTYSLAAHAHFMFSTGANNGDWTATAGQITAGYDNAYGAGNTHRLMGPVASSGTNYNTSSNGAATVDTVPSNIGLTFIIRIK